MNDDGPDDLDLQRNVAEGLRRWRHHHGLSQYQAGQALGMHWSYVGEIERGLRNMTLQTVQQWADRLDVDPLDLLRGLPDWATE